MTGITSIINLFVFSGEINPRQYILFLFLNLFNILIGHYFQLLIEGFIEKLMQIQERTETELENKGMFVASISHDLKNPLNSLLGCLDLLKDSSKLTEKDKNNILTASYSGQIMTYLIGNILDTSKIEAGKFDIDRLPMDIIAAVSKVISIEEGMCKKKGIKLYSKCHNQLPKLVYGDAMRISQILINIIGNSIKFVSRGYIGVILSWATSIDNAKNRESAKIPLIPPEEYFEMESNGKKFVSLEDYKEFDFQELPESVSEKIAKYNCTPYTTGRNRKNTQINSPLKIYSENSESIKPYVMIKSKSTFEIHDKKNLNLKSTQFRKSYIEIMQEKGKQDVCYDSGLLIVDIIDTGIGITQEEQKRLFKPFNQANNLVRSKYGGTGLGLWITKQLVCQMSGFIELKSIPGKGTRFTITLPFKVINDEGPSSKLSEETKCTTTEVDPIAGKEPLQALTNLRKSGKILFTGENKMFHNTNILIIENENFLNDSLMEQIIGQIMITNLSLIHANYSNVIDILKKYSYKFIILIVIFAENETTVMKEVIAIMKEIKDAEYKQMPICIAAGKILKYNRSYRSL